MDAFKLAKRLYALHPQNPEEAGIYHFIFGSIFAAEKSKNIDNWHKEIQDDRWGKTLEKITSFAKEMAENKKLPEDWPDFYFNNALFRVDVGFERVTRYISNYGGRGGIEALKNKAIKSGIPERLLEPWEKIRNEVNALKHRNPEALFKERVTYEELLKAIEKLIETVELSFTELTKK
jgi:hypothetical protein